MIDGTDFDDVISANWEDNTLTGNGGNDVLNGRWGNDLLLGGAGADTFIYQAGQDVVQDFTDGIDNIMLDDWHWREGGTVTLTPAEIISIYGTMQGGNFVLDFGNGNQVTYAGISDGSTLVDDISIF